MSNLKNKIRNKMYEFAKDVYLHIKSHIHNNKLFYAYLGNSKALISTHYNANLVVDLNDNSVVPTLLKTGWWEPWIDILIRSVVKPGFIAIDIGSNCGYHTNLIAQTIREEGKLFAFEANPTFIPLLKRSLFMNGYSPRVSLYNAAVFDKEGFANIGYAHEMLSGGGILGSNNKNLKKVNLYGKFDKKGKLDWNNAITWGSYNFVSIKTVTLDDTVGKEVKEIDFLHMDVEGCEPGIILGAKNLISRSKNLHIISEWTPLNRPKKILKHFDEAIKFLVEEKFEFYKIEPPKGDVYTTSPELIKIEPNQLKFLPHCDLYIVRRKLNKSRLENV